MKDETKEGSERMNERWKEGRKEEGGPPPLLLLLLQACGRGEEGRESAPGAK